METLKILTCSIIDSKYGAFDESHVYKPEDVNEILEAARLRGIRVVPEFDLPGHSKSWNLGQPGLLTECRDFLGDGTSIFGPVDPTKESNFEFLAEFFSEIFQRFPDPQVHLGADEVELSNCW